MPFTFSHPAVVLPLARLSPKFVSLTGLVTGSVSPDFEYYIHMRTEGDMGHTLAGLVYFNLPLALVLSFAFHTIVRNPLIENLPTELESRLNPVYQFNWKRHFRRYWLIVMASIIAGAASHLAWDGFTHTDGFFVKEIPALQGDLTLNQSEMSIPSLLQKVSSLAGGMAILLVIWSLPRNPTKSNHSKLSYWLILLLVAAVIFLWRVLTLGDAKFLTLLVTGISAVMISLLLTPAIHPRYRIFHATK